MSRRLEFSKVEDFASGTGVEEINPTSFGTTREEIALGIYNFLFKQINN